MLLRVERKGDPYSLLVGFKLVQPHYRNKNGGFSKTKPKQNLKILQVELPQDPGSPSMYTPREC